MNFQRRRLSTKDERKKARDLHAEDQVVEVDDDAEAAEGEDGTWVQAWVWIPKPPPSSAPTE